MPTLRFEVAEDGIATVTFDAPGASVNTMTAEWQHDLAEVAARLGRDKAQIRGVLLASAKRTFFAGAALKGVLALKESDAVACFAEVEALKKTYRTLETLGRPVVALLAGSALGGGWEVALVGHARFALDDESLRFGMPEVTLGLIPGGTGITKTVRQLGLRAAEPYLLEGRLFGPREALELGWVDGLAADAGELRSLAVAWIDGHPEAAQPWDRRDYRMPGGGPASPAVAAALALAPAALAQKTRGLYPAPQAILEAMVEGALVDYDTATRIESRKLAKVMVGQVARNMIQAFFFDAAAVRAAAAEAPVADVASRDALSRRVIASYRTEGTAMRAEGIPALRIERAALAVGMATGPLASPDGASLHPEVVDAARPASRTGAAAVVPDLADLGQRLLYRQAIEAARCLHEGVVASAAAANVASLESGFPAWTGGALQFIVAEGIDEFVRRAASLEGRHGAGFEVPTALAATIVRQLRH